MESEKLFRKRLAAAENMAVRQRNYRRARDRALAKLSTEFKERYLELLAEEKEKDEKEGKRWNFHSNSDSDLWTLITTELTDTSRGDTSDISQDEGNQV